MGIKPEAVNRKHRVPEPPSELDCEYLQQEGDEERRESDADVGGTLEQHDETSWGVDSDPEANGNANAESETGGENDEECAVQRGKQDERWRSHTRARREIESWNDLSEPLNTLADLPSLERAAREAARRSRGDEIPSGEEEEKSYDRDDKQQRQRANQHRARPPETAHAARLVRVHVRRWRRLFSLDRSMLAVASVGSPNDAGFPSVRLFRDEIRWGRGEGTSSESLERPNAGMR